MTDSNETTFSLTTTQEDQRVPSETPVSKDKIQEIPKVTDTSRYELESMRTRSNNLMSSKLLESEKLRKQEDEIIQSRIDNKLLIPVEQVPSQFNIYPANASIYYSRYDFQDLEDLNNKDLGLKELLYIMLDGIYCRNLDKLQITTSDFHFISVTRKLEAMGAIEFKHPYECVSCLKRGVHTFTLADITFKPLITELPVCAKFSSYPDEIFRFVPNTIGDVLTLLNNDLYYRKLQGTYLLDSSGNKIVNTVALLACCCTSHKWQEAYEKLLVLGANPIDRGILTQVDSALEHGIEPITFKCKIPISDEDSHKDSVEANTLIEKLQSGELSLDTANEVDIDSIALHFGEQLKTTSSTTATMDNKLPPVPDFVKAFELQNNMCKAENQIDVDGGDIIIPFREPIVHSEYGILS